MSDLLSEDLPLLDYLMDANRLTEGWQDFLDKCLTHFNLRHINLYMLDPKFNLLFQEWSGIQPTVLAIKDYLENHFANDTVHQTMLASPECKWITGNFEPYQSMLNKMPGFHVWTKEHNFPYTTGCVLFRGQQGQVQISFQRGEEHGPFTIEEENRFSQVSHYLAKAIEIRVKLADQSKNDVRLKSVLNKFKLPVTAVNEFGEIVAHNNAMVAFLQSQDILKIDKDQLSLTDTSSDRLLKHAIVKSVANAKNMESTFDADSSMVAVKIKDTSFIIGTCELHDKSSDNDQYAGVIRG